MLPAKTTPLFFRSYLELDSFQSVAEELEYYKALAQEHEEALKETSDMLEEFQLSSKELEAELENEIESTERRCHEMKIRNESMRQEVDEWKVCQSMSGNLQKILSFFLGFLGEPHSHNECIGIIRKKTTFLRHGIINNMQEKKGDWK